MWDLPGPGLEPVSPALAGGFLTTAPPGKPTLVSFLNEKSRLVKSIVIVYLHWHCVGMEGTLGSHHKSATFKLYTHGSVFTSLSLSFHLDEG